MATYTRGDKFTPVNIASDPSAYLAYNQKILDLKSTGEAMIRNQYKSMLDMDLTHTENKNKVNTFLNETQEKLSKIISTGHTEDLAVVNSALGLFDPLSKDPQYSSVAHDASYTKHYKEQNEAAEFWKNQVDKKGNVGLNYSDKNYMELQQNYAKFKNGKADNTSTWGERYDFKPYYDYTDEYNTKLKDFMAQPDSFEVEAMVPMKDGDGQTIYTGQTQKIKIQGKDANSIKTYLNATLSEKAKEQILLEGRVDARSIFERPDGSGDDLYLNHYTQSYKKNIKELEKQEADLIVFRKTAEGAKVSDADFKKKTIEITNQKTELQRAINEVKDPKKRQQILNSKVDNYASEYLDSRLGQIAISRDNFRKSTTLGTNQAFVSFLNLQQDAQQFAIEQQMAEKRLALDTKKVELEDQRYYAGLTSKEKIAGNGNTDPNNTTGAGNAVYSNSTIPNEEQALTEQKKYEADLSNRSTTLVGEVMDLAGKDENGKELGWTTFQKMAYAKEVGERYKNGEYNNLINRKDSELNPEELKNKKIVQKLRAQDDLTQELTGHITNIKEVQNKNISAIEKEIRSKNILARINGPIDATHVYGANAVRSAYDYLSNYNSSSYSKDINGKIVKNGGGSTSELDYYARRLRAIQNSPTKERDLAELIATDPKAAEIVDRMTSNSNIITYAGNRAVKNKSTAALAPFGTIGYIAGNVVDYFTKPKEDTFGIEGTNFHDLHNTIAKDVMQNVVPVTRQLTISRPSQTNTPEEKELLQNFTTRVNNIRAKHADKFEGIADNSIIDYTVKNGSYIVRYRKLGSDSESKDVGDQTGKIEELVISDPEAMTARPEDLRKMTILSNSKTGSISIPREIHGVNANFKITTTNGQKYTYETPLAVTVQLPGMDKSILLPKTFINPTDAELAINEITGNYKQKLEEVAIQDAVSKLDLGEGASKMTEQQIDAAIDAKVQEIKSKGISAIAQEKFKKYIDSGEIYADLGAENPNKPSAEITLDRTAENIKKLYKAKLKK